MGSLVRVLVAEDSLTVRRYVIDALHQDPNIKVIGEAADGRQAIELCQRLRPDVVTLDMLMPELGGLEATEQIMAHCPTPIIIISASNQRGDLVQALEAIRAGALDAVDKPTAAIRDEDWALRLCSIVKVAARIKVITHLRGKNVPLGTASLADTALPRASVRQTSQVVALGTSTGGPPALVRILQALPADYPLPIFLVIHIGAAFGAAFVDWLDNQIRLPIAFPTDGLPLPATPQVWLAPPDYHMVIEAGRFRLNQEAERHACRPSIDVLFESVAREYGGSGIGVLLTGMGKDGAAGLLKMRQAGAFTMAQDEASSVVYGMPQEAAKLGAANEIVALDEVAPTLLQLGRRRVIP